MSSDFCLMSASSCVFCSRSTILPHLCQVLGIIFIILYDMCFVILQEFANNFETFLPQSSLGKRRNKSGLMMYLLPSSSETPISVPAELRDSLSCLDIVWSDMFECEDSVINSKVCRKQETDFLKGAPPQWVNVYSSVNSPLVERDRFKDLIQLIEREKGNSRPITEVSLRYQSGSGGSTLTMQVLWRFRKDLRCARVINSVLDTKELSKQVVDLFLLSNEEHAEQDRKTVLLLLDTKGNTNGDLPIKKILRKKLKEEIHERDITTNTPVVIIFNCSPADFLTIVRSTDDVKLKMEISPEEKKRFDQEKKELKRKHKEMSKKFHAFNIMQGGFQKEDAKKVITEEMETYVENHKESSNTRLLSFLALINLYVPGSHLSKLLCEEFMDQTKQPNDEEHPTLETIMKPFMDLIVIFSEGEQEDQCIRLAHPMIADACLKMLTEHKLTRFDIALDFLNSLVKGKESNYAQICRIMLVVRSEVLMEKEKFSRLILDIINESENNTNQLIDLLKQASDLFSTDHVYPQALARLYYIEVKEDNKYEEARTWAEEAITRGENSSHIRDTLGQVHKNHLLNETKKAFPDINVCLPIAQSAIKAFKEEAEAAENESEDDTEFNYRGLFAFLQVCKIIHPKTPLEQSDQEYSKFITGLKCDVEKKYDFFEWFLAFSRPRIEDEDPDYIRRDIEKCYKLYCTQRKQNKEMALNEKKMKSFGGLLNFLKSDINVLKENLSALKNPQSEHETVLYILANIILSQSGEACEKAEDLQARLQKLWATEAQDRSPEFYLLILLLFWPDEAQPAIANPPDLEKCVQHMNQSYKNKYQKYLRGRYLLPLFFFGNGHGLQRLIHSSKLDEMYLELLTEGHEKAEVECLQRINGKVENHKVFAVIDGQQIQVTPHNRASVYKQGLVSFYLGFNIRKPVAFNIRYEENCKSSNTFDFRPIKYCHIHQTFVSSIASTVYYSQ